MEADEFDRMNEDASAIANWCLAGIAVIAMVSILFYFFEW